MAHFWRADPVKFSRAPKEIEQRRERGEFDDVFYEECLSSFNFSGRTDGWQAETVILLSAPRPAHILEFSVSDRPLGALIPPTHLHYRKFAEQMRDRLAVELFQPHYRLELLSAPLKNLAVRLGMARYGRNNLTYTDQAGSYHQLVGFLTDARLELQDTPAPPAPDRVLPECGTCSACMKACPTAAIRSDRFLLRAEGCLTYFSESLKPWPDWLPGSAHHCLIGCLKCQRVCPRNSRKLKTVKIRVSFPDPETDHILSAAFDESDTLWQQIRAKLVHLGLVGYENIMGRNLRAILRQTMR